ncbi:fimbrial protein [Pseudomonas jinjuensis]|uniref:Major type 1 subunit fimbrin (Pilin) n=1 Tax=Pseudomonas jinjuensis TaxID=198616 RepID=A0A1H0NXN8_9PSED|nr:fimbrial protein [Pseudomonas jinjuensis]SDO97318.1 major type 1 subunit fimbrin (pilin) [Pseudomonas jinjuensis]
MKQQLLGAVIVLAGAGVSMGVSAATPQTGIINITGKVTETSCVLDSASTNLDVHLPTVDKTLLADPQSSTGRTGFAMQVSSCDDGIKVSAAFTPDSNVDAYGNLKNGADADKVQVQLLDQNQNVININTDDALSQSARAVTVSGGAPVTLQYYAQYYSQEGGAGAGDVSAMANFQLTYE